MEPPDSYFLGIIIIFGALIAIAVISSAESSIIAVSKFRIRHLVEGGDSRAKAVQRLFDQHDRLFSAVILSGNLFTILATSVGTAMLIRLLGEDYGVAAATLILTYLTVVFGELTPKTFSVSHSERVSLFLARPLELYVKGIYPLIWIFHVSANFILRFLGVKDQPVSPYVTEEEIKTMISIGEEEGTIEEEEKKMLHRVFEFGDTEVSEAMVPRTELAAVTEDTTVAEAMKLVAEKGFSRYPVVKETIDNIQGILYIKDLMITMSQTDIENLAVSNFMREAYSVPENKMVTELLDEMRRNKFHIAVVVDEYGGTAGLVTLEDIMEEIVGGLQDEFEVMERAKEVEIIDEKTFIVSGQTPLDEMGDLIGEAIESEDFNTIGGYVFGLFGRLPKVGELEDRRIAKVKITKL
jgi:CBS domain containing-hemolysin-like protein